MNSDIVSNISNYINIIHASYGTINDTYFRYETGVHRWTNTALPKPLCLSSCKDDGACRNFPQVFQELYISTSTCLAS